MLVNMTVALGADSAGYILKEKIKSYLSEKKINTVDFGAYNCESSHYPEFAYKTACAVSRGECNFGILICGTGIGMSISANKVKGIRAAAVSEHYSTRYTRLHNDANILCLGARTIGEGIALELVDIFLNTKAEKGRHLERVKMIAEIENEKYDLDNK